MRTFLNIVIQGEGPYVNNMHNIVEKHFNMSITPVRSQRQYSLFSLGMFTYTYERQDMIQIALKRLPGGAGR
jgi:hypothetical protein